MVGEDLVGGYQSLSRFSAGARPEQTCSESIRIAAAAVGAALVEECLAEVGRVTRSRLETPSARAVMAASGLPDLAEWPGPLAALVMYTFDLSLVDMSAAHEGNFYHRLNGALRRRDPVALSACRPYLWYLMRGLEALPSPTGGAWLWRGVGPEGRALVEANYTLGRKLHWSGISSATTQRAVAEHFADGRAGGAAAGVGGGILLRVRLARQGSLARDVRLLSALPGEAEALLLPNFACRVTEEVRDVDGWPTIDLLEDVDDRSDDFVF